MKSLSSPNQMIQESIQEYFQIIEENSSDIGADTKKIKQILRDFTDYQLLIIKGFHWMEENHILTDRDIKQIPKLSQEQIIDKLKEGYIPAQIFNFDTSVLESIYYKATDALELEDLDKANMLFCLLTFLNQEVGGFWHGWSIVQARQGRLLPATIAATMSLDLEPESFTYFRNTMNLLIKSKELSTAEMILLELENQFSKPEELQSILNWKQRIRGI